MRVHLIRKTLALYLILAVSPVRGADPILPNIPGLRTLPTAQDAANANYRFAFTGQVLNALTGKPIPQFSVEMLQKDSSVAGVFNALGDRLGLFHISRRDAKTLPGQTIIPVLISASGFEPVVRNLSVFTDCRTLSCVGQKAAAIELTPTGSAIFQSLALKDVSLKNVTVGTDAAAIQNLLDILVASGKIDPLSASLLAQAKRTEILKDLVVVLNSVSTGQAADLTKGLLANGSAVVDPNAAKLVQLLITLSNALLPLIAASNPQIGAALLAANAMLMYIIPIIQNLQAQGGFGKVIANFVQNNRTNFGGGLLSIVSAFSGRALVNIDAQGIVAKFLPIVQSILANLQSGDKQKPFEAMINAILKDPALLNALIALGTNGAIANPSLQVLAAYLQPLIQGLASSNGTDIAALLNELIKTGGVPAIAQLLQNPALAKYAALIPYVETLIKGLNGTDGATIAALLNSLIKQNTKNPASAILALLQGNTGNWTSIAAIIFPTIQTLVQQWFPSKQLLSAQVTQGLFTGALKDIRVTQDLKAAPAVLVSGTVEDILKLLQMPNVQKLVIVE